MCPTLKPLQQKAEILSNWSTHGHGYIIFTKFQHFSIYGSRIGPYEITWVCVIFFTKTLQLCKTLCFLVIQNQRWASSSYFFKSDELSRLRTTGSYHLIQSTILNYNAIWVVEALKVRYFQNNLSNHIFAK